MKDHIHRIEQVKPDSIAWEMGLEPGDALVSVNGQTIEDIFDYHYHMESDYVELEILTRDGENCLLEIEKDEDEDLGIVFGSSLMDEYHSCSNRCIFCFIDQLPPGMRESLYFKDDDSRLSFLQGNYITLTNMGIEDIRRLIRYRLSPINISVHTSNPDLRCRMLNNRFAGDILDKIRMFYDAGIRMNSQIVLCKGINDGKELSRTIEDLSGFLPYMESLSVVPVGLTRYREQLAPLEPFDREDAKKVLDQIQRWQDRLRDRYGTAFVHASDEWFILAGEDFPPEQYYEGYGQLENGVGMMRLLIDEVSECLACPSGGRKSASIYTLPVVRPGDDAQVGSGQEKEAKRAEDCPEKALRSRKVSIATGLLAYPTIRMLADRVEEKYPGVRVLVYPIRNDYFGERITVSGLLTGVDIISQLIDQDLGEELLLPENVLKSGEEILLDDTSLSQISHSLQVAVNIIQSEGRSFVDGILGEKCPGPCPSMDDGGPETDEMTGVSRRTGKYEL